jgi:hypothetical protein
MIYDDAFTYVGLSIVIVIVMVLLFGCASEPPRPIDSYRAAYGFTP